mmetsp:Transcript_56071/g.151245  ORF Transcript_56071/g.151245 Transcript_56071/m.151245 type:complete len:276 (+) Transcript_56071:1448-2275(+)
MALRRLQLLDGLVGPGAVPAWAALQGPRLTERQLRDAPVRRLHRAAHPLQARRHLAQALRGVLRLLRRGRPQLGHLRHQLGQRLGGQAAAAVAHRSAQRALVRRAQRRHLREAALLDAAQLAPELLPLLLPRLAQLGDGGLQQRQPRGPDRGGRLVLPAQVAHRRAQGLGVGPVGVGPVLGRRDGPLHLPHLLQVEGGPVLPLAADGALDFLEEHRLARLARLLAPRAMRRAGRRDRQARRAALHGHVAHFGRERLGATAGRAAGRLALGPGRAA